MGEIQEPVRVAKLPRAMQLAMHPLAPLCVFAALLAICNTTYVLTGAEQAPGFELVTSCTWSVLLLLWILADARTRRRVPCFDFAFFVSLFFPVSVVWYCLWSRGWRGVGLLVLLFVLWFGPYLVARAIWEFQYGSI